jgi:hypothetical protein
MSCHWLGSYVNQPRYLHTLLAKTITKAWQRCVRRLGFGKRPTTCRQGPPAPHQATLSHSWRVYPVLEADAVEVHMVGARVCSHPERAHFWGGNADLQSLGHMTRGLPCLANTSG